MTYIASYIVYNMYPFLVFNKQKFALLYNGTEVELYYCGRGCQIPVSHPLFELIDVRKNIQSPKTHFNIPRDKQ